MTITLPESKAVLDLLSMFIGSNPVLRQGQGPDYSCPAPGTYITHLKNAEGAVEGAIITDLAATLYIGGGLIMMPEAGLKDMWASGEASEAILDGVGEIFNNVRALLNKIELNPHVNPTEPCLLPGNLAGTDDEWIMNPGKRVDLTGPTVFGIGTMTILGR